MLEIDNKTMDGSGQMPWALSLKGIATGTMNPPLSSPRGDEEKSFVFRTVCGICSGTCGMALTIEKGRVKTVEGDDDHPVSRGHLCPKGRAFGELLASPDRLRGPLKKTVSGGWEQISWSDAFRFAAKRLREVKDAHGPEALGVHVGQAGVGKEFFGYAERFCDAYGTPNFSTSGSLCFESKFMANVMTYGVMPVADYENSQCIVLWGKNPLSSTPSLVREIAGARARGCALIVVDPRQTVLARDADLHLQVRPGTDGALALAMIHVIVEEGLYDRTFVDAWTIGFERLAERVREYTPRKAEEITWVPQDTIRRAARLYASSPSACIAQGVSLELGANGFQTIRAIAVLQAITSNLDIPGGAMFLREARLADLRLVGPPDRKQAIGAEEYPLFHASSGHAQSNFFPRAILEGKPYPLHGLIVAGGNPLLTWPNAMKTEKALKKLDFLAVMDPFMTETAALADLVLPCATFLGQNELWDSSHLSSEARLGLAPKWADEAGLLTNWEVWKGVAEAMGYGEYFPWETEEEAIDFRLGAMNLTLDDLRRMPDGYVYYRWTARKYEDEGFRTPSGKVEIYSSELERHGYDPLPAYREPGESPVSTPGLAARYPLVLTTGARTLGYLHSRFRNLPSLLRRSPEPFAEINPRTAAELGVEDGEMVLVETRRAGIRVRLRYTPRILPKVISLPHGWARANANALTDDEDADPVTGFPADRCLLARITKIEE